MAEEKEFKPGETVPASGIYRVTHEPVHVQPHDVTAIKGEHFPTCNHCGEHPRFVLRVAAEHIKEHHLFRKDNR
jgi:hypothetical protein